jgi:hypothetical protein
MWTGAKVLLVLAVTDWWVRGPFFFSHIAPRYVTPFPILRDRTGKQHLRVIFDSLGKIRPRGVRVVMLGDSTMNAVGPDPHELPYLVGEGLRRALPETRLEVVHFGLVGLYAADAPLLTSKLLRRDVDVIVYGLELRAFPAKPRANMVTAIASELSAEA